jgi:hypothetical protein
MDRHFAQNSADSIRPIARAAFEQGDLEVLRDAVFELSNFRTTGEARRLLQELAPLLDELEGQASAPHQWDDGPQPPERWLSGVQAIAQRQGVREATDPCCVYLVLLRGPKYTDGFGVYVGQTALTAEQRFQDHKNGYKPSRDVKEFGVRLLRPFFDHLQGLSRNDAERIERELAHALKRAGYWVEGGH